MSSLHPHYYFRPKEDISAYELARLTPILIAGLADKGLDASNAPLNQALNVDITKLPEDLQEHFEPVD